MTESRVHCDNSVYSPVIIYIPSELHGVLKKFSEWYQKTNKIEDTNKLTLLAFKIIAILHNILLATFIKLLETVSKGLCAPRTMSLDSTHPSTILYRLLLN
jgi:hypothetical protein